MLNGCIAKSGLRSLVGGGAGVWTNEEISEQNQSMNTSLTFFAATINASIDGSDIKQMTYCWFLFMSACKSLIGRIHTPNRFKSSGIWSTALIASERVL